jgi:hypothetical protein
MIKPTINFVLASVAFGLAGCQSGPSAQERQREMIALSYTGELLRYRCGGYRPDPGQPMPCAPSHGYSKDDAGYRTAPAPRRPRNAPTPTGYVVKTFRIGPHVDPANPRIVQGGHTAYQVIGQPGWNLHTVRHSSAPLPLTPPASEPKPGLAEANQKAQEAADIAKAAQRDVEGLKQAQLDNAQAVNANQQLLVDQINALKAQQASGQGKPMQATQADPNFPQ